MGKQTMVLVLTLALAAPVAVGAVCGGDGGGGRGGLGAGVDGQAYRVPWEVLSSGDHSSRGTLVLYWFPESVAAAERSDLMNSRELTVWASRCVGMALVPPGNQAWRQNLGVGSDEVVVLMTESGGEIGRRTAGGDGLALDQVESLLQGEFEIRRSIVDQTLDAAKQRRGNDEDGAASLYREVIARRCLFPAAAQKAAKGLRKLDRPIGAEDSAWLSDDAPQVDEPDLSRRTTERMARSITRGLEAESDLRIDEARRHYDAARSVDRSDPVPIRYLGELYRRHLGDWDAATDLFERILDLPADPLSRAVAQHGLGTMALDAGERRDGLRWLESSAETFPLAMTYRDLASYWASEGEPEKAREAAEAALALDPEDPFNQLFAATCWPEGERADEARALAQRHDGLLEASYNLAVIYAQLGEADRALDQLERYFSEYRQFDELRNRELGQARREAAFQVIRDDPRFRRLTP